MSGCHGGHQAHGSRTLETIVESRVVIPEPDPELFMFRGTALVELLCLP
jgi:hypothetical protein